MTVALVKCSLPNAWRKEFPYLRSAVVELRGHVCGICLSGGEWGDPPLDFEHEGRKYVCMDAIELLSTGCGLEYELEGDHGLWPQPDEIGDNIFRHSSGSRRRPSSLQPEEKA